MNSGNNHTPGGQLSCWAYPPTYKWAVNSTNRGAIFVKQGSQMATKAKGISRVGTYIHIFRRLLVDILYKVSECSFLKYSIMIFYSKGVLCPKMNIK